MTRLLKRILAVFRSRKRMFNRPQPFVIGQGIKGARALHAVLICTKPDAMRARSNNYRRSVQRILDCSKN